MAKSSPKPSKPPKSSKPSKPSKPPKPLEPGEHIGYELFFPALVATIRERREFLNLSQNELGIASGLHRSYIGDFEGAKRNISVKNLSRLAVGLQTTPSKLLRIAEQRVADPTAKISMSALDTK